MDAPNGSSMPNEPKRNTRKRSGSTDARRERICFKTTRYVKARVAVLSKDLQLTRSGICHWAVDIITEAYCQNPENLQTLGAMYLPVERCKTLLDIFDGYYDRAHRETEGDLDMFPPDEVPW